MAALQKFNLFADALARKTLNLASDSLKVMLTNTAPVATNSVYADLVDLATAGGYTAGGAATTPTLSNLAGVERLDCTDVVFTATTGFGPFRYAVLYDDTATNKDLVGWCDFGSSITLGSLETFTVDFNVSTGVLTIT